MKKIIPLVASMMLILVVGIFAGSITMAYFNDTETSYGNTLTAGTLDLQVDGQDDPHVANFDLVDLKPGDGAGNLKPAGGPGLHWTVKNVGSIPGVLTVTIMNVVNKENGQNEPEALVDSTVGELEGELGSKIRIQVWRGGIWTYEEATLNQINGKAIVPGYGSPVILGSGVQTTIEISWCVFDTAGNEIQSDSVSFDVVFQLDQVV